MQDLTIVQLLVRFEDVYGCILKNKAQWVTVYNTYMDRTNIRYQVQVGERKFAGLKEPILEYRYTKWGRWDWEAYEHFVRTPNHTRTQYGEGVTEKYQKAVAKLPKNIINKVLTHQG